MVRCLQNNACASEELRANRQGLGALVKGRCAFDEGRLSGNCAVLMALVGVRAAFSRAHSPIFLGAACCTSYRVTSEPRL